jgi:FkbM family methyltransferase
MTDGRFVSYAQHGEDVILWRALGPRTDVFYVDVGAYHPTFDSVTKALYERGWRGINIEAQADRIAAFDEERPEDTNLAVAIGDHDGTAMLTVPENQGWASLLTPGVTGADSANSVVVAVPVRRLSTVLAEHSISRVDVLKVDVEGAEPAVIRGMLDGPVRPTVCIVEGAAPGVGRAAGDDAVDLLVRAGYAHCMFDGLNHYLTLDESLAGSLSVPANPLDGYVTDLVEKLMGERVYQSGTIARLVAENAELRGTSAPEVRRGDGAPTGGPIATATAATPGVVNADAYAESVSELPFPGVTSNTPAYASLAVPTRMIDAVTEDTAPKSPEPFVAPEVRRTRRRETFSRLLRGAGPAIEPRHSAPLTRLGRELDAVPPTDAVSALYRLILGRFADPEGLASWVEQIETGLPLISAAQEFARSDEARRADPAVQLRTRTDLANWAASVALDGTGAASLVGDRLRTGRVPDQVFVEALYEVALCRQPSPTELDLQLALLETGTGRERMTRAFAGLPAARAAYLERSGRRPRAMLRAWRARRGYLTVFRSRVMLAESRRLTELTLRVVLDDALETAFAREREDAS